MIAFKFLARGGIAPFTGFRWPAAGTWVSAPGSDEDAWIRACRTDDLPYWLDEELWRIELAAPVREDRYQLAAPRGRLVARVAAWEAALASAYARACALRARDLALPRVAPALREALEAAPGLEGLVAAVAARGDGSREAAYVADAAQNALHVGPATTSYIAAVLASTIGGGIAAFEAERAWQARWLSERLGG